MANARKKVIVRLLTGEPGGGVHFGYLPGSGLLDSAGDVSLLDLEGRVLALGLSTVRHIAYVRDFNLGQVDPERLTRTTFLARPRTEGVWLRLTMVGGETLEGLAAGDVSLADGLLEDGGLFLTPPDVRSNTQRLFVPRSAFSAMVVVAVIGGAVKARKAPTPMRSQEILFP